MVQLIRLSALGLVVASAGFGAVFAWKIGSEHSLLLGALSVLFAVALECIKPFAIAGATFSIRGLCLLILGLVAIGYSITSELSLITMNRNDLTQQRKAESTRAKTIDNQRNRIEQELSSLGITRPASQVRALLDGARKQKNNQSSVTTLKAELAKAERREQLESDLSRLTTNTTVEKNVDPGSTALATYLGSMGVNASIDSIAQWLALVPVLAMELGSALAVVLVQSVNGPGGPPSPVQVPQPVDMASVAILNTLKNSPNRTLQTGERGLAALINGSKGTTRRALQSLVAMGLVSLATSKDGSILRLVA